MGLRKTVRAVEILSSQSGGTDSPSTVPALHLVERDPNSATFTLDRNGRVLIWSLGAERTEGYRAEEIVGRHSACFYTRDEVARGVPEQHLQKAAAEGRFLGEGWRVRKDGSRFWASIEIVALRAKDGSLRAFSQVAREVTGHVLSRAVLDSLREQICVLDREGTIMFTNQAWRMPGKAQSGELAGGGVGANYVEVCRAYGGAFTRDVAAGIALVLSGASPYFAVDYAGSSSSGKTWFRLTAQPMCERDGSVVIVHSDITGMVLLAEKIQRTKKHYGALMDSPAYAATILDADGTIHYMSPAAEGVFGLRPEELLGRRIFELVHAREEVTLRGILRDCLRHPHRRFSAECRFRNRDGSWRIVQTTCRRIPSTPDAIALNSCDITHQRSAEKTLQASQKTLLCQREELGSEVARLFRAQEEERRQVAAALNGYLGQRLAALSLQTAHIPSGADVPARLQLLQDCLAGLGRDLRHLADASLPAQSGAGRRPTQPPR